MESKNICIDTDIIIGFLKNKEPAATCFEVIHSECNCFITTISSYELWFGVEYTGHKHELKILDELLNNLTILPFDLEASKISAKIDADLYKKGRRISIKDILIASICINNNIPLLTQNTKHFARIHNLKLLSIKDILS